AGGEVRHSQFNSYYQPFTRGQLIFPTFTNFLLGQSLALIGSGVFDRALRMTDLALFVQDDWAVTDRLTLNVGLRYDVYGNPADIRGRLVNFLPDQFHAGTPGDPAIPPNG